MKYKVLITTSGTGSRLGEKTRDTNKALVKINGKPTIEYIFRSYPENTDFVVTLGYLGDQVREYLTTHYSKYNFEFVEIDKYKGEGSSLLYSIRCTKDKLQCPFIFHACDTIVIEEIPQPSYNWVIGYVVDPTDKSIDTKQYRTHKISDQYLSKINDKGIPDFDSIHIGMTGINDYKEFWDTLEEIYTDDPNNQSLGDVPIIEKLLDKGIKFKWIPFKTWLDTGNLQSIANTEKYLADSNLV